MSFSAKDAVNLASVIDLVVKGAHVRYLDEDDNEQEGTLRHLTPAAFDAYHFGGDDVREAWVRITLKSGLDVWERLTDLATKRGRGELGLR